MKKKELPCHLHQMCDCQKVVQNADSAEHPMSQACFADHMTYPYLVTKKEHQASQVSEVTVAWVEKTALVDYGAQVDQDQKAYSAQAYSDQPKGTAEKTQVNMAAPAALGRQDETAIVVSYKQISSNSSTTKL